MRAKQLVAQRGGNQHQRAVTVGNGCTHGHQHIHVGAAVAQGLVSAGVIVPTDPELHRCGQNQESPVNPWVMRPHAQHPEISQHGPDDQRNCEDSPDN